MTKPFARIDPDNLSLYAQRHGIGPLASEHVERCGHAIPKPSAGDAIPEQALPRVQPGDIWRLDRLWLICGDSTDAQTITTALGLTGGLRRVTALLWDPLFNELIPPPEWTRDIPSRFVFTNNHYIGGEIAQWGAPTHILAWDAGGVNVNQFDRETRDEPLQNTKLCLWYGRRGGYDPNGDRWDRAVMHDDGRRGRAELTDVYRLPIVSLPAATRYQKPVDWVRRLIGCLSADGVVLDPFAGTGTSLVAAQQLDRPAVGIEIDPAAANIALTRMEWWTGTPARRERTLAGGIIVNTDQDAWERRARSTAHARRRLHQRFG